VLSGFLITGILVDSKDAPDQLRNFYMRRFLRIFPLYYAFLLFMFVVVPHLTRTPEWMVTARSHQWWYWLYLINWVSPFSVEGGMGHLWSLAIEEQFYIFWPLLVAWGDQRRLVTVCLGLIASAAISRALLVYVDPEFAVKAAYTFTVSRWDSLALGALLAVMIRNRIWFDRLCVWSPRLAIVLVGCVFAQLVLNHNFVAVGAGINVLNQTTIAILFAVLMFMGIVPTEPTTSVRISTLSNKVLQQLGKYSYAIYIIHLPILYVWFSTFFLNPADFHGWQQLGIITYNCLGVFSCSLILAVASWYLLEKPFLDLKRFFVSHKSQ
jgi:peptidoglycan/LPS O-acetylase OafA/YrhL